MTARFAAALCGAMALGSGLVAQEPASPVVVLSPWTSIRPEYPAPIRLDWPLGHVAAGLDTAADGTVYALDATAGSVRIYDAGGSFRSELGPRELGNDLTGARDIAVWPGVGLAIADTVNNRVAVVAESGQLLTSWSVPEPRGLRAYTPTESAPVLWVVSRGDRRLYRFDAGGELTSEGNITHTMTLDTLSTPDQLWPSDVTYILGQGQPQRGFVVTDPVSGELRYLPESGIFFPRGGALAIEGVEAVDIGTLDRNQRPAVREFMFAGAPGRGLVPIWRHELAWDKPHPESEIAFQRVRDIAAAPDGNLYLAVEPQGLVRFDSGPALYRQMTDTGGRFLRPRRLAVGRRVLMGDALPRAQVLTGSGGLEHNVEIPNPVPDIFRPGPAPLDVAAGDTGDFVLETDGALRALAGGVLGERVLPDAAGRLFTAVAAAGDNVAVLDLPGQAVELREASLQRTARFSLSSGRFEGVVDVAHSGSRVFVAESADGVISAWDTSGQAQGAWRVPSGPARIATNGERVVALSNAGWIHTFSTQGESLGAYPVPGGAVPEDVAIDSAGVTYLVDRTGSVHRFRGDGGDGPTVTGDGCGVAPSKSAAPPEIDLGESVRVTLRLDGDCPGLARSADVMLVLDVSGSMQEGNRLTAVKEAAVGLVAHLDPLRTRIGIVTFESTPMRRLALTSDRPLVISAIMSMAAGGGTDLVGALDFGRRELAAATPRPGAAQVIVFLSDGFHAAPGPIEAVDPIVDELQRNGVHVFTVGLGPADEATLLRIATDPSYAFLSPSASELRHVFDTIARRIDLYTLFATITVADRVADFMAYVPGSASPSEPSVSPDGRTLEWRLTDVLTPGFELSYDLVPQRSGRWPTNDWATAEFVDGRGEPGDVDFPVPYVRVRYTGQPRAFLPIALAGRCDRTPLPVDLVLVADGSTSMSSNVGATTGIAQIRAGARALAEILGSSDRTALVVFSSGAMVEEQLTADAHRVVAALDALPLSRGSRIDLGIDEATSLLSSAPVDGRRQAIVVFSDGISSPAPLDDAIRSADRARGDGIAVFAVGVGAALDSHAMARLALPGSYFAETELRSAADAIDRHRGVVRCQDGWLNPGRVRRPGAPARP